MGRRRRILAGRTGLLSFDFYGVLPTVTEKSIGFVQRQTAEKPFFLYIPLTAPHTPWMPTKDFRGRSKVDWYGDFVAQVDTSIGADHSGGG